MIFAKTLGFILVVTISSKLARAAEDADIVEKGYRTAVRVYEECQQQDIGLAPCLKKKAISFLDRVGRINGNIPIIESVELIKNAHADSLRYSDQELETLGRAGSSREDTLNTILFNKVTSLMNGFDLQISLPKMTSTDLKRSIEEGRGKMKKMMKGMMMMGMGMKMLVMIPLGMAGLFILAGKAFIVAKIALVLSLIIALKKLLQKKGGGGGGGGGGDMHHGGGWQSSGGGGGGGGDWDRSMRSLDAVVPVPEGFKQADESFAHSLAYKGQISDSH